MKHIHKYIRTDIGEKKPYVVYKCALPECTHYLAEKLALGKLSICWRCGNTFQLVKRLMLKKPHCDACTKRQKEAEGLDDFLDVIGVK